MEPVDISTEAPPPTPPLCQPQTSKIIIRKRLQKRNRTVTQASPQQTESASNTLMKYIIERNQKSQTDVHPVDAFFQGLSPTVKTFSPYYQHLAKGRIFSIVQELEYAHLNSPRPTSATPPCSLPTCATPTQSQSPWTTPNQQVSETPPNKTPATEAETATTSNMMGTFFSQFNEDDY